MKITSDNIGNQEVVKTVEYDNQRKSYSTVTRRYNIPDHKPLITYWKSGDPCYENKLRDLESKMGDYCIIRTKRLTREFIEFCVRNKQKIYIHMILSGLNRTPFEPNIPTVAETFRSMQELFIAGFPMTQLLLWVDPVIPNRNGLAVLKLILRMFSEFPDLRLRRMRVNVLGFKSDRKTLSNPVFEKRQDISKVTSFVSKDPSFEKEYQNLLTEYASIISVDNNEYLIGIRELNAFGLSNQYSDNGVMKRIIEYDNRKPNVKIISGSPRRCGNRCVLCPYWG